jgi:flagellar L-ring protein precursor FlgH
MKGLGKTLVVLGLLLVGGCNTMERLENVGRPPPLRPIENPVERHGYQPVSIPMPPPEEQRSAGANSLWREGARGFFRDQRARRVGDLLTVSVTVDDRATLSNETARSRSNSEDLGIPSFLGLETKLDKVLPSAVNPASLVGASSDMSNQGRGNVRRQEAIDFNIAATIVQVLPNGNMVIDGRQEIRVNFEVREIGIAGIVRPEDITPGNRISHEKIAELRVAYGGRGQITDVQQPRYGAQILDIILPY